MKFFIDFASGSLNKYKEELCGDRVEFYNGDDKFIAVMSDGLGSGVKANILATLTSKIALTMLKEGLDIEDVVDTIIKTLPICKVRKVSYSTFTIINIDKNGIAYIVEFDNPSVFFLRNGDTRHLDWNEKIIDNRKIRECKFELKENDFLVIVSDGAIYAGVGEILNLGWGWKDIAVYLRRFTNISMSAKKVNNNLLGACNQLYMEKPGDDTTVMTIKVVYANKAILFSGPPIDKNKDKEIVQEIMGTHGKRIVCGGTAANIVSREIGAEVKTSFRIIDRDVPPIGYIDKIDLVTEGVLTLKKTIEKLRKIKLSNELNFIYKEDGASQLAKILYEDCTHIKMIIGRAINPAHQNPDFPNELSIKLYLLNELRNILLQDV